MSYDDDVHPYSDLADRAARRRAARQRARRAAQPDDAGFVTQPETVAVGHYVGVLAPANAALRDQIDDILRQAMRDGTLEAIFRKWNVWNDDQPTLFARVLAGEPVPPVSGSRDRRASRRCREWEATRRYLPSLLRAVGRDDRAFVPGDGAGGGARRADRRAGGSTAIG